MAGLIEKGAQALGQVMGIFNNNQPPPKNEDSEINTPDQQQLVEMAYYDYQVFKEKRTGIEEVWRKEQRMWKGDHWQGLRPPDSGPYPERMEYEGNYAWSQIESIVSRLTGWVPAPDFEAMEEDDEDRANLLNMFIPYELNVIKFKPKHIRAVRRMVIHGPLVYKVLFDPTVKGGKGNNRFTGQNDILPMDFGSFFPDPAIKDFINLQKGRANIINNLLTIQFVRERWPKQGAKVQADSHSSETEIFDRDNETSVGTTYSREDNQTTTNVLEYWYKGKPKYMSDEDKQIFNDLAKEKLSEGLDPSEALAKAKGQMEGVHCLYVTTGKVFLEHKSYVYDHGQYPIVARTIFPEENNPWGKGYMRDMISSQTMLNRLVELAADVIGKMGNSVIVYGAGAGLSESLKQIWRKLRSKAGGMLPVTDVTQVKELQGVPPNPGIMEYIQFLLSMMQKISGMYDSANGASNPNVTSGRQSEALISAAQGRLSMAAELIEDAVQEVIEQYIALCAQFYTTERVARITKKNVSFSRDMLVKRVPTTYDQENPENEDPTEVRVEEEYVPSFDIKVNIGVEKPKDREYYIQTAMTLFNTIDPMTGMPCIDAQAVKYTVENGRMEPMSVIEERMQTEQQLMQKVQELQQQNDQLQQENQAMGQELQQAQQANQSDNVQKQQFEQQYKVADMAHKQEMDQRKMANEEAKTMVQAASIDNRQPVGAK